VANPQAEDGHVDIANEIIEALAKIRISGEEMQCLWVIFRKTYGWHKKQDDIALSQFCQFTNLKKPTVCRAISKLLSKKIIVIIKKDNGISSYGFNKDFETWEPLSKKITLSKKIMRRYQKRYIQKKTTTKENINITLPQSLSKKIILTDDEFLKSLKDKFTWVDFDKEMVKIDAWFLANPGRQKTRRFIVKWISKVEKPMILGNTPPTDPLDRRMWEIEQLRKKENEKHI